MQHIRRVRHRLLAAGDIEVAIAGFDCLRREHNSFQARTADLVHRHGAHAGGNAAEDRRLPGGVLALTALIKPKNVKPRTPQWALVGLGVFAACLMYGDGMITPAISVLSAVEGVKNITPLLEAYIIPTTIIILGGVGSLPGALIAGAILGLAETFTALVIGSIWAPVVAIAVLFAVLVVRPTGLMGKETL